MKSKSPAKRRSTAASADNAAVLRDDEDDAARLVLADELQQREDPQGELIVVQCELARLPSVASRRRLELQLRSDDLIARYRKRLLTGLPLTDVEKYTCTFHRGFPFGVLLSVDRFLRVGDDLFEQSSFSELSLTSLGPLAKINPASLSRVRRLVFQPPPGTARHGPQYLVMRGVKLFGARIERLETLRMAGWWLHDDVATLAESRLTETVRTLDLSTTYIDDADVVRVCGSEYLPNLTSLSVGGNRLTSLSAKAITERAWPLTALSYGFGAASDDRYGTAGQLGSDGLKLLASAKSLAGLRALHVENQQIDDTAVEALCDAPMNELETLSLAGNVVTEAGVRALAGSKILARGTTLDLSLNATATDFSALARASLPQLVSLRLAAAGLDDAQLAALCEAPWIKNLVELDLSGNPLTDKGVQSLARAGLEGLATLDLRGMDLHAAPIKELEHATNLLVLAT